MKKIMKLGFLALLLASTTFVGCTKLHEEVVEEHLHRPNHDVDISINPPWDSIPQSPENQIGK